MEETMIIAFVICFALTILGYWSHRMVITILSSIGVFILAIELYNQTGDYLILGLLIIMAIVQVVVCPDDKRRSPCQSSTT